MLWEDANFLWIMFILLDRHAPRTGLHRHHPTFPDSVWERGPQLPRVAQRVVGLIGKHVDLIVLAENSGLID